MNIVFHTSAALNTVSNGEYHDSLRNIIDSAGQVFAPELYYAQCAAGIARLAKELKLSPLLAKELYEETIAYVDCFVPLDKLSYLAFHDTLISEGNVYESYYLELAKQTGSHLVSLDKNLNMRARVSQIPFVRLD
jgi:predicted nucleic acid-binding protein